MSGFWGLRRLLGQLAALNSNPLHVPLCLLLAVPRRATTFSSSPALFSVQCYDNWSRPLQAFAGGASSQEPTLLRGAVPQPGPHSPSLFTGTAALSPPSGAPCHLWASSSCPPGWPLQLGAANSALWALVRNKCPGRGEGRASCGTGLGNRQVLPMVPKCEASRG